MSYLVPTDQHWACDIEADDLLEGATTIWCVCLENVTTGSAFTFTEAASFRAWVNDNPNALFVGHNFIAYDAVMLNKFWGAGIKLSRIVDTYVLSQMYNPSLSKPKGMGKKVGTHSLQAWGVRLKRLKTEYSDFSRLTPKMLEYCQNDTGLTALLYRKLSARMAAVGFSEMGVEIEHKAWNIIQNKQRRVGFPFNKKKAEELYVHLRQREEELKREIYELWPPQFLPVREFAQARKRDGTHTENYKRHLGEYPKLEIRPDGRYVAYDWVSFDLGSPAQRVQKLLELGWVPVEFTPVTDKGGGGNPKVDEDSLLAYAETSGQPEVVSLAKWIVINSRANMVNTWLNAYNEKTGSIHGSLFIASTLRYKHSNPNSANIPAVRLDREENPLMGDRGAYTYECRDLFYAGDDPDFVLVGLDGTGIQNRCLIHNLIKTVGEERVADFKALSLEGDIHKRNIELLGLANKAAAKKFYYTLMMGGGGGRLAADQVQFGTKMTESEGTAKKKKLINTIPGFGELTKALRKELDETGRIRLCDGTPIIVSSPHMVIPYLLQGDESRLMKLAMIYLDEEVRRNNLSDHVQKVADIHDEFQYRIRSKYVDPFIELALPCFRKAGRAFDYRIPIDGEAKVGRTWAATH